MNKCLSLVHLTSKLDVNQTVRMTTPSWFLRCNFRADNHLPKTPQLRVPASPFSGELPDHQQLGS